MAWPSGGGAASRRSGAGNCAALHSLAENKEGLLAELLRRWTAARAVAARTGWRAAWVA
ncbi:hypothetical protein JCGZ_10387 [Jatropha curcas]|uniref:Uncharacterized protein n=1 Tax=Jatropha curcas TaxID=180498 RepID=A0A067KK75_JATCU|nr:hypothetical protein JCGZ_10387 [Jatropha curcas]